MHLLPKQASSEDELKVKAILELPPKQASSKDSDKAMEVDYQMEKLWVKIEDVQLTVDDRSIVTEGGQLSDKPINAVQRLLQEQHPNVKGLCSTIVAGKQKLPPNGLQGFFVRGNHWIVLSTMNCRPGEVNVYDCTVARMLIPCQQPQGHWRYINYLLS